MKVFENKKRVEKCFACCKRQVVDIGAREQTVTKVWSFFFNCQPEKKDAACDLSQASFILLSTVGGDQTNKLRM
jgi:hypothetical protein